MSFEDCAQVCRRDMRQQFLVHTLSHTNEMEKKRKTREKRDESREFNHNNNRTQKDCQEKEKYGGSDMKWRQLRRAKVLLSQRRVFLWTHHHL